MHPWTTSIHTTHDRGGEDGQRWGGGRIEKDLSGEWGMAEEVGMGMAMAMALAKNVLSLLTFG